MKKLAALLFSVLSLTIIAQAPTCPNNQIYIHSGSNIYSQTVPLPGAAGLVMGGLPGGSGGLAVGPNLGFPAPNPTYWTCSGGTYWYYNGTGWTNTGHSTGNGAAVNIGCGGGFIYNLVGGTGQIYVYNGTGPGTLLTTIAGFSGGGPYDVVCDAAGNFFILKNTAPQSLSMYGPNGVLKCSWSHANNPTSSAGGGFAIVGNTVYYHNGSFHAGNIIPGNSTITFSNQASIQSPSDFASCPIPVPTGTVLAPNGGTLSCSITQLNLVAQIIPAGIAFSGSAVPSSSLASCNYTWSGPGIIAGQGTATITVNQPGVYSYTTCAGSGCPSYSISASYTVVGQGSVITPVITAPACLTTTGQISVVPNTSTNTITWSGPGITSGQGTATIGINAAGIYSVSITNTVNACAGTGTVMVNQTPTVNISLTGSTLCSQGFNGSPNSITVTATGASSYTWSSSAALNFTAGATGGPFTVPSFGNPPPGSYTLGVVGSNGTCSNSAVASLTVIPNPTISVTSGSICQGNSFTISVIDANTFSWVPSGSLNTSTGSTVIANPQTTTVYSVVGSSFGCNSSTANSTITVIPNPSVTITPATPTICAGSSINLTAGGGATNFTWTPSTGLSATTGANVTANPSATQTYTVIGSLNTCTNTGVITVSVIPVPSLVTTVNNSTFCAGYSANITVNGATSYTWSPSAGLNTTTGNFGIATPSVSTTYTITGYNGTCNGMATVPIYVVPQPQLVITSPSPYICSGGATQITATGAQSFSWSPATGLSSTIGNVVNASPLVSTNYTVIASNSMGTVTCSELQSYSVVVIPNAQANLPSEVTICVGDKKGITASGGSTYTWSPSFGLNVTSGAAVVASPSVSTIYTVFSSYNGNCGTTGTVLVNVNPLPTVYAGRDTTFNLDDYKSIKAIGTGTLTWIDGEEIWCKVCPETQLFATRSGCYKVQAENEFGCKATDDICIAITNEFGVYIPNVITPNGDGVNDIFYVYGYSITDVHMSIFNRWGEKLFSSSDQTVGWPGTFKGVDCQNGVYVYKVDYKGLDGKIHHKTGHVTINR